jgi:hypothetical protein
MTGVKSSCTLLVHQLLLLLLIVNVTDSTRETSVMFVRFLCGCSAHCAGRLTSSRQWCFEGFMMF